MCRQTSQCVCLCWNKLFRSGLCKRWSHQHPKLPLPPSQATGLYCTAMQSSCDITMETCIYPAFPQVHPMTSWHLMLAYKKLLKESHVGGLSILPQSSAQKERKFELGMTSFLSASLLNDTCTLAVERASLPPSSKRCGQLYPSAQGLFDRKHLATCLVETSCVFSTDTWMNAWLCLKQAVKMSSTV